MSIFTRSTLGYSDNQVVFNDVGTDPYYRVNARAPQKYQIREQDLPIPFESGIADYKTLIGQTLYVIDGTMYPRSQNTYDTGLDALRLVSNLDVNQADDNAGATLSNDGYVPYSWGDALGDLSKQLFVKPLYIQAAETTRQGYVVPFRIFCKIKDPTIYGGTIKTASSINGTPSGSAGSAKYPFKYPIAYGATYYTVTATATNNGTLAVYPTSIDVYGPVTNPTITNVATGESITVNCTLASASDHLAIVYNKDYLSITVNGVSNLQNVTTDTSYFKIQPGTNVLQFTGTSISTGAYMTVSYLDGFSLA